MALCALRTGSMANTKHQRGAPLQDNIRKLAQYWATSKVFDDKTRAEIAGLLCGAAMLGVFFYYIVLPHLHSAAIVMLLLASSR